MYAAEMDNLSIFLRSVAAGILIGIGAVVKLSCSDPVTGSVLFSIGLFFICCFGLYLFTGKITHINKNNWKEYPIIWGGNFTGCIASMLLARIAKPELHDAAKKIMSAKLDNNLISVSILALFCGVIMYLAVDNYKNSNSEISKVCGIVIGVTVFLMCGFEHSIADMAYAVLAVTDITNAVKCIIFILVVSAFNGFGSILMKKLSTSVAHKKA